MVAVHYVLGLDPFLFGADGYGCAVAVAARDHQDLITLQPVITGKDIGWQIATSQVAQVQRTIGIGPGDTDEDSFCQRETS